MKVEEKCNEALASVKESLSSSQYNECHELINKHGEWLLSLEFAIDYIVEKNILISPSVFKKFYQAFLTMDQESNERLSNLKLFVRPEPTPKEKRIIAFANFHTKFEITFLIIAIVGGILYALFN